MSDFVTQERHIGELRGANAVDVVYAVGASLVGLAIELASAGPRKVGEIVCAFTAFRRTSGDNSQDIL